MLPGAYFQVWTGVNNFNKCVNQGLLMTEYKGKPPQVGLAIYGPQKRKLIIAWTCLGSKSVTKRNLNMFPKAMQRWYLANTAGKVNRFKKKKNVMWPLPKPNKCVFLATLFQIWEFTRTFRSLPLPWRSLLSAVPLSSLLPQAVIFLLLLFAFLKFSQ